MTYQSITHLTSVQTQQLCELYQQAWWSQGRTLADVQQMLRQSDYVFGICDADSQRLLAFARVLSDRVYRAVLLDVIVTESHRGLGLGQALMDAVLTHPELSQVELIQLFCLPDMVPFYKKFDFLPSPLELLTYHRAKG